MVEAEPSRSDLRRHLDFRADSHRQLRCELVSSSTASSTLGCRSSDLAWAHVHYRSSSLWLVGGLGFRSS